MIDKEHNQALYDDLVHQLAITISGSAFPSGRSKIKAKEILALLYVEGHLAIKDGPDETQTGV